MALLAAVPLRAQDDTFHLSFGVKGGVDIINMDFTGESLKSNNRAGFFIGPVLKFKTPVAGLNIDVSALYDERNLKIDDRKVKQQTLVIPAHVRMGVSLFDQLGLFACVGPQLGVNIGKDTFQWRDASETPKQFLLQQTTLSFNLGAGVTLGHHLEGALYYNVPLGKTGDFSWSSLTDELSRQNIHLAKSKSDAWRLSVTYFF